MGLFGFMKPKELKCWNGQTLKLNGLYEDQLSRNIFDYLTFMRFFSGRGSRYPGLVVARIFKYYEGNTDLTNLYHKMAKINYDNSERIQRKDDGLVIGLGNYMLVERHGQLIFDYLCECKGKYVEYDEKGKKRIYYSGDYKCRVCEAKIEGDQIRFRYSLEECQQKIPTKVDGHSVLVFHKIE